MKMKKAFSIDNLLKAAKQFINNKSGGSDMYINEDVYSWKERKLFY